MKKLFALTEKSTICAYLLINLKKIIQQLNTSTFPNYPYEITDKERN